MAVIVLLGGPLDHYTVERDSADDIIQVRDSQKHDHTYIKTYQLPPAESDQWIYTYEDPAHGNYGSMITRADPGPDPLNPEPII